MMRVYNIRRPCPSCGSTGSYQYGENKYHLHPVPLHPGIYGVFYQKSPYNGKKLPTTLFNGKGKLLRKCDKCGNFITADAEKAVGTEFHIGVVGHTSSGKTYLLYTALSELKDVCFSGRASQMDAEKDTNINSVAKRIRAGENIPTDRRESYKAVQMIVKRQIDPVPYHLFFYDVAGELFQAPSNNNSAMDFYRNVQTVIFLIDPAMLDYTYNNPSEKMGKWLIRHQTNSQRYSPDDTLTTLKTILESVGRKKKKIECVLVCVKADTGYFEACDYPTTGEELGVEHFIRNELGLNNLVDAAKGFFKKVSFEVVSVKKDSVFYERLPKLFVNMLKKMGVN